MRISPLFNAGAFVCGQCGETSSGWARWRFDENGIASICARHISLEDWTRLLSAGGQGLQYPSAVGRVGPIRHAYHLEDYQDHLPGNGAHVPPEDELTWGDHDDDSEASGVDDAAESHSAFPGAVYATGLEYHPAASVHV